MPKLIKTIVGGIVSKSVKLQVFIPPNLYIELIGEAKANNWKAGTDSILINKVIEYFVYTVPVLKLEIERLRKAVAEKNSVIEEYMNKKQRKVE